MINERNLLYRDWEDLNNFFKPSLKLKSKVRVKSRYVKKYDTPATAFELLKASGILSEEQQANLQSRYNSLDPFVLEQRIQRRLRKIEKMKKSARSPQSVGSPGALDCRPCLARPSTNRYLTMQFNDSENAPLRCHLFLRQRVVRTMRFYLSRIPLHIGARFRFAKISSRIFSATCAASLRYPASV
jgi:hypothetical protein